MSAANNVFDNIGTWAYTQEWANNNTGNLTLTNNWTTNNGSNVANGTRGNINTGTVVVTGGNWPSGARAVMAAAGVQARPAVGHVRAARRGVGPVPRHRRRLPGQRRTGADLGLPLPARTSSSP